MFIKILHWFIIINFLLMIGYSLYMIFSVFKHDKMILFSSAKKVPHQELVIRRLYCIEFWIAIVGLSIYLAITVIGKNI